MTLFITVHKRRSPGAAGVLRVSCGQTCQSSGSTGEGERGWHLVPPPIGPCGGRRAGLGSRAGRDGRGALQGRPFRPVGEERADACFHGPCKILTGSRPRETLSPRNAREGRRQPPTWPASGPEQEPFA